MVIRYLNKFKVLILFYIAFSILDLEPIYAQLEGSTVPQQIKWLAVSDLRHWFSNGGAEIEYGRRGRGQYLNFDQIDGLGWPNGYNNKMDVNVGNSLWIGTKSFLEPPSSPQAGVTYPFKVAAAGRRFMTLGSDIIPQEISLIARFPRSNVTVDGVSASIIEFDDDVDVVDPSIPADRMIYNVFNTSLGITVTRKIYAFTQQYNDNYFIYDCVFKNTGIINNNGTRLDPPRTLDDVVFFWQHRYALAGEAYRDNWLYARMSYGRNTIYDEVGQNPGQPNWDGSPYEFRACYAWHGPHSAFSSFTEGVGFPRVTTGLIMGGTQYVGIVLLHADRSATDKSDDSFQPTTTTWNGADQGGNAQTGNQYDVSSMSSKYYLMTSGHPPQTHAQLVGRGYADQFGNDPGGYQGAQGFGPYDLAPGDSIRIVFAEGISGISREKNKEIMNNWFNNNAPYNLPGGTQTSDRNAYKEAWVFTGKDSLFQSFRRAIANFNNNFNIPQPPPPPNNFSVSSGGNRIRLEWSDNAETDGHFNGYIIYRAEGRTDTTFEEIYRCDKNNVVHLFDDKNARRGFNYYYYIQSKSDGTDNPIQPGVPLVSSKFYTMTNREAFLTRPPGNSLSDIRVVPNPYNIKMRELQFGQDAPDRLAFYGLPPVCTIRIYTETGDLIETIEHTNGSGDELWHSLTSSRQIVVSGLYIAYFEVTEDTYNDDGSKLLFRKGDNIIRKFIIIR